MTRWSLSLALVTLLAATEAKAFCRTTTSRVRNAQPGECATTGVPLSWRNRCTNFSVFRGFIPQGMTLPDFDRYASEATGRWANAVCDPHGRQSQYYRVEPGPTTLNPTGYNGESTNSNTISFRPRWNDDAIHRERAIAITIVTFDSITGEIYDADMELNQFHDKTNPTGFRFSTSAMPSQTERDTADLQTILTHEFGHFLGLSHSGSERAVMWFEAGLGEARRDLTSDDVAGICTVYSPAEAIARRRCTAAVPYGGQALFPGNQRVGKTCSATPGAVGARGSWALLALATAAAFVGRRRNGCERALTPTAVHRGCRLRGHTRP